MKKYELTEETKTLEDGTVLHRIRAVKDFTLADGTKVLAGDLGGWIEKEYNLSHVGSAWVYGDAKVCGDALVCGNAKVCGDACVSGNACVYDDSEVYGDAKVYGNALVCGDAKVYGNALVCGNAKVCGNACVYGNAEVCGNAEVYGNADYITFKNSWSSGRWFTYTRSNKMWKVGCFHGTSDELVRKAYADSELSGKCYEAIVRAVETIEAAKAEAKGV